MKAVIQGRLYDTQTATEVASHGEGGPGDFRSFFEILYRSPNNTYFLCGKGGPMTRYSQPCDGGRSGGSAIIPLSDVEARDWLANVDVEALEAEPKLAALVEEA